jgi:hypothetical protein
MRSWLISGFIVAVLIACCAAQDTQPRVKPYHDRAKPAKSAVVVGKTPPSSTQEANLRRLEQQGAKLSAQGVRRTAVKASPVKVERERPTPQIRVGSNTSAKGSGSTNQGTNPYRGRLRQKGSHH